MPAGVVTSVREILWQGGGYAGAVSIVEKDNNFTAFGLVLRISDFVLSHRSVKKSQGAKHSCIFNSSETSCVSYGGGKETWGFGLVLFWGVTWQPQLKDACMVFLVLWCTGDETREPKAPCWVSETTRVEFAPGGVSGCELSTYAFSPLYLWVASHFSALPHCMIHQESFYTLEPLCSLRVPSNLSGTSIPSIAFGFLTKIAGFFCL